jgi:hypothetical protein
MKLLKSCFNPEASKLMESLLSGKESMLEGANVGFFLAANSRELTNLHNAYNHPKPDSKVN